MLIKAFILLVLLVIVLSLASAMLYLVSDKGQSNRTVKALSVRIGLSFALFVLMMIGVATGLIQPHGIYP